MRQFERLERALRAELGVAPSRAAEKLRERLLAEVSAGSAPAAQQSSAVSAAFDLVGRDRERQRLEGLVAEVSAGHGRTLFVGGPAGVGKTAVLTSLERYGAATGMRVGSGAAAQIEGAWPYAPVLEAVADLCRRHPALLDGLDDALREEIERSLSGRETAWRAQSGDQRLFVAVTNLVRLAAAGAGAVLVVDDAHDADDASARLIHYLARSTLTDRVLIVIAHRPKLCPALAQVRHSLLGRGNAVTLDMTTLAYDDVAVLVRRHAPEAQAELIDAVWAASDGLPFAVVELARTSVDGHANASSMLPAALSAAEIDALAAAAVLGVAFDTDEFVAVTAHVRGRRLRRHRQRPGAPGTGPYGYRLRVPARAAARCGPRACLGGAARRVAPPGRAGAAGSGAIAGPDRLPPGGGREPVGRGAVDAPRRRNRSGAGCLPRCAGHAGLGARPGARRGPGAAARVAGGPADGRCRFRRGGCLSRSPRGDHGAGAAVPVAGPTGQGRVLRR